MLPTLLIVDDEKHTREGLRAALEDDYDIYLAASADEAFNVLEAERFDLVLTDLRMAGKSGLKVIDYCLKLPVPPITIMMTAYGTVDTAVQAMKRGAHDFLTKPVNLEKLELLLKRALHSRHVEVENEQLHQRLDNKYNFNNILGSSEALEQIIEQVKLVAPTRATVLIQGETGTGKELVAQALHQNSPRARQPFIAVHCAALAANLLESELFGHEKGAFTGATERRKGRFEGADGGTLFLDEIGEIDASTQVKLLRFLETKSFERLGANDPVEVDVRLVAATNRDLLAMVKRGEFREDLYYRLNVVRLELPPLRSRDGDIALLLEHFMRQFAQENGIPTPKLTAPAIQVLSSYRWPGNIRELRNFAENTVVLHRGGQITEYDLEPKFFAADDPQTATPANAMNTAIPHAGGHAMQPVRPGPGGLSIEENEKRLLRDALMKTGGNRTKAAELLGMSRRTLHRKINRWPELDPKHGS